MSKEKDGGPALTETQKKVLHWVYKAPNHHKHIGGNGMAPYIVSARSLVKRGYLIEWRTAYFAMSKDGIARYENHLATAERQKQKEIG